MPLLRIDLTLEGPRLHGGAAAWIPALRSALANCEGPVVLLTHGFKYRPGSPGHCPHRSLFNASAGWPASLGFGRAQPSEGLCIALGWDARGALPGVHRRAARLGVTALAPLLQALARLAPGRDVQLLTHSLGATLALSSLPALPPSAAPARLILLSAAAHSSLASAALQSPAGRCTTCVNVVSRENAVFDRLFELASARLTDRSMGAGLTLSNVVTLRLDCRDTLARLAQAGNPVAPPRRRICHWSSYTRPGAMSLYARLMRDGELDPTGFAQPPRAPARSVRAPRLTWIRALPTWRSAA